MSNRELYGSDDGIVDKHQVENFAKYNNEWWDPIGPVAPLHAMNKLRIPYVIDGLLKIHPDRASDDKYKQLKNFTIMEVGCGGGILTEGLALEGCKVVGVDAGEDLITLSKKHAEKNRDLDGLITYVHSTVEGYAKSNKERFDAIIISEVIEHIPEKDSFMESVISALKPGGSIFITTFNRTWIAWFLGIIMAENVFKCIPKNSHDYGLFISPEGVENIVRKYNCRVENVRGMSYIPWKYYWYYTWHRQVSYVMHIVKNN